MTKKTNETNKLVTVDAAGRAPGRVATEVAKMLRGKHSPSFERHQVIPVQVKVTNANKLKLMPAKADSKLYVRYSGYPGGQKLATQSEVAERLGKAEVLRRAVYGMLPGNKLRPQLMKRLKITD